MIMEETDSKMVRLRLVFEDRRLLEKSQRSQGLRRCWFLLKPEIASIGDLVSQICECFGLRHRIVLSMDDFVLPSFQSTCIIMDKDIIRIHDLDDPGDFGPIKRKRKRSEKLLDSNGQHDEINHENEFGPSNNSDVTKAKDHDPQEKEKACEDDQAKACEDDQARKDNWEEPLVKGGWNERNASSAEQSNSWAPWIPNNSATTMSWSSKQPNTPFAEQSNSWAPWIPNKSATTMSWSFKQPNTPFAGRGDGRIDRAPNRCMNTTVPSKNTTNWNPNRNNATWNPNRCMNTRVPSKNTTNWNPNRNNATWNPNRA